MRTPIDHRGSLRGRRRCAPIAAVVAMLIIVAGCGGNGPPPPFQVDRSPGPSPLVGLEDSSVSLADPEELDRLAVMAGLGARVVRVTLTWSAVAPAPPADARDPNDPVYAWDGYDAVVREARNVGLEVLFSVWGTPTWAADPAVVADLPAGVTTAAARPRDPADLGAFATAAARRYTPLGVRKWEGWNEPNVPNYLYPQFARGADGVAVAVSPGIYAGLQRAFYDGIKQVAPRAIVAGVVTAPAGDAKTVSDPRRVTPQSFIRALDAPGLRPPMDVVSHHPYPTTPPRAKTRPGRNYIDLYNLEALTQVVDGTYLRGRDLWLTEYGFGTDSVEEYPLRFTPEEQAINIADAYGRMLAEPRVKLASYYLLQDHERWRSGLREIDGTPKPGEAAFVLPFARMGSGVLKAGAPVRLAGQARTAGRGAEIQLDWRAGGGWERLATIPVTADGSFGLTVRPTKAMELRARWEGDGGSQESPPVRLEIAG